MATSQQKSTTDKTAAGTNGAKTKRKAAPRIPAAQRDATRKQALIESVTRAAKRVAFCDEPPQGTEASVIACAVVNSVLTSIANALTTGRLPADVVREVNLAFLEAAGVEEVDAPMGGTTFQRRAQG